MNRLQSKPLFALYLVLGGLLVSAIISEVRAAPVVVPTGLAPGDPYRLAFVTSAERDAISSDIADYNAFVTSAAAAVPELAALGTIWRAIGSTSSIDARDNTGTNPLTDGVGVPVYSLDGVDLIALNNADLWDGTIVTPIRETENGTIDNPGALVWTGSWFDGTGFVPALLGDTESVIGISPFFNANWIAAQTRPSSDLYHLYALSGVLVAPPSAIPVVPSILLLAVGIAGLGLCRRSAR